MRDIIDAVLPLLEASWNLSSTYGYRSWYHPATNQWVKVKDSHQRDLWRNASTFGLERARYRDDSDPDLMNDACANGWVRVAAGSPDTLDRYMVFEGSDLETVLRVFRMFYRDQRGELASASIKVRNGDGHGAIEYGLLNPALVRAAATEKTLPAPHRINQDGSYGA